MKVEEGIKLVWQLADQLYNETCRDLPKQGLRVSCLDGCSHCCMQVIDLWPGEWDLIKGELIRQGRDPGQILRQARDNMQLARQSYPDNPRGGAFRMAMPCPLLKDGRCSVYEYRPFQCRVYVVASPSEDCNPWRSVEHHITVSRGNTKIHLALALTALEDSAPLPLAEIPE